MKEGITDISLRKRIVVIGGGFAGLNFLKHIDADKYDITIVDKNNYHCFPPLFYQVASAGLDPASICFPLRRELRKRKKNNITFHMGMVRNIDTASKEIHTEVEILQYDILLICCGTTNNFFNMPELEKTVYTLKSTAEALRCRNDILDVLEHASIETDPEKQKKLLNFVVVGGGPTGVEMAGAIGEMKRYVMPREYPSIPQENLTVTIVEGNTRLLGTMSEKSSERALTDLKSLMVDVRLGVDMNKYEDGKVTLSDGSVMDCSLLIWTAGVTGVNLKVTGENGTDLSSDILGRGRRWKVDGLCKVIGLDDVYALGDVSIMENVDPEFPKGHPQLAQVAIQQGRLVASNLNSSAISSTPKLKEFRYNDNGSMATIGRNRAVVDLKTGHMSGVLAWFVWMFIHLISILGMRNKLTVLINWIWAYFNYSTSLRLLIHPVRYPVRKRWDRD